LKNPERESSQNGNPYEMSYAAFFTFRDSLIVISWILEHRAGYLWCVVLFFCWSGKYHCNKAAGLILDCYEQEPNHQALLSIKHKSLNMRLQRF